MATTSTFTGHLTDIADAIRLVDGGEGTMKPAEMPERILLTKYDEATVEGNPVTLEENVWKRVKGLTVHGSTVVAPIPLEYTVVDRITTDGAAYINTGVTPTDDTHIHIRYGIAGKLGSNYILGSRIGTGGYIYGVGGAESTYGLGFYYSGGGVNSTIKRRTNMVIDVKAHLVDGTASVRFEDVTNGVVDEESFTYDFESNETPFHVLAFNTLNVISANHSVMEVSIHHGDNPAFVGVPAVGPDGAVGLFDTVTKSLVTSPKGVLTAGDTVPYERHLVSVGTSGTVAVEVSDPDGTVLSTTALDCGELRSAGSVADELDATTGEVVRMVGARAHQDGDEGDASVVTDGTTTYYQIATPTVEPHDPVTIPLPTNITPTVSVDCDVKPDLEVTYLADLDAADAALTAEYQALLNELEA